MSVVMCPIRDLVDCCRTWNPADVTGSYAYIDLSSVDKGLKAITQVEQLSCSDAPSRARQLVASGDVLVATVRPNLNGVAVIEPIHDGMTASTGYCVLRPKRSVLDPRYLFHWVRTPHFVSAMVKVATGATYPAVSDAKVKDSLIPLQSLAEQKHIVAILDAAEALQVKRRASIAQIDLLVQAMFSDMFGNPVVNPKGWDEYHFADVIDRLEGGKNVLPSEGPSDYRILKVSAVTYGEYRPEEAKWLPADFIPPDSYIVRSGDLLISRANTVDLIGATAYVWDTPARMVLPDKIWRFVWRDRAPVDSLYVFHMTRHKDFQRLIGSRASGTSGSMKNISKPKLLGLTIPLPPLPIQQQFAESVRQIRAQRALLVKQLADLDFLLSSLQSRAFNGELSISVLSQPLSA